MTNLNRPHLDTITRAVVYLVAALTLCATTRRADAQWLGLPGAVEASTGFWQKLNNQPPFQTDTALLLTDGTVMVHQYNSPNWWRLTPDNTGSYLNGTWSQRGSMQSDYAPLYYASAVLPDGRVLMEGGEYNFLQGTETNKGSIYDPLTDAWTEVFPPAGWSTIGDSPGIVQADGTFMLGQGAFPSKKQAIFNAATFTWTAVGQGKADFFTEEGFALLPNGSILTIDCQNGTNSETYNPVTGLWTTAGSTIVPLADAGSLEIGPTIQRPDGTVIAFGGTPHTSIFNTANGTWTPGPDFPNGNDIADGPACILPDGNVLAYASPGIFNGTGTFFIFDGVTLTPGPFTAKSGTKQSWQARMLLLPTGQVMWLVADGGTIDVELFTSTGQSQRAWAPNITSIPRGLSRGQTYQISGTQFNGLSVGADYGDDATMGTNFPLVRFTNQATGHVFFGRTHDHSTMAIATGNAVVSTMVDVPANAETGSTTVQVVANGIASRPRRVVIR